MPISPIKVLLVEDSPIALEILQRILSASTEIKVVGTARNGKQALDLIPSIQPDVICVDYYMDRMDGLELTRQLMAKYPRPVLIVSIESTAPTLPFTTTTNLSLPDHTQLPDSDGTFVKNFQEHPQSAILTSSIKPILENLHPDGRYCIGQDSGIYWRMTKPAERGAEAPDWFYVANVPPLLNGKYRRSYVLWKEFVAPLIAVEFVSGDGSEERDATPVSETEKPGKFWVYEQAIRIPFYAIYEENKAAVEVYHLVDGRYQQIPPNEREHYPIAPLGVELGILWGVEEPPIPWLRWWDADGNLLLTGDERAAQAEAIATQAELAKQEAEAIATQAKLAKQEAEAIASQERLAKEQAEVLLQKYRDLFGEIPE
jgi:CheY-like chemotaxis protein